MATLLCLGFLIISKCDDSLLLQLSYFGACAPDLLLGPLSYVGDFVGLMYYFFLIISWRGTRPISPTPAAPGSVGISDDDRVNSGSRFAWHSTQFGSKVNRHMLVTKKSLLFAARNKTADCKRFKKKYGHFP